MDVCHQENTVSLLKIRLKKILFDIFYYLRLLLNVISSYTFSVFVLI